MTPAWQKSTAVPSCAASPTGTVANEDGDAQAILPPSGMSPNQIHIRNDATPTGTAADEEEANPANAVPRPRTSAGGGAGTQRFNLAAEDDSA